MIKHRLHFLLACGGSEAILNRPERTIVVGKEIAQVGRLGITTVEGNRNLTQRIGGYL